MVLVGACNLSQAASPTATPTPSPTATPVSDISLVETWQPIAPGLEERLYIPNGDGVTQLLALRLDPQHYTFRVHYRPGEPLSLRGWRDLLPDAAVIINANFFTPEHTILGLLVSDGVVYGQPYLDRGGMFAIQNSIPRVRSNIAEPYQGEALEQAAQAFPMLVLDGAVAYQNPRDTRRSRRTVIGQDTSGRIIMLATPFLGLSLPDLSAYLPTTDLNLTNAFNLDGGGSTMLWIAATNYLLPSLDAVPAVIAVYPR
jgi:uncharacterized protein YigE (DUF2233 family)